MIFRSLCYSYLGAVLAGLLVSIVGAVFGLSQTIIVAAASPAGIVAGLLGLSIPMARPVAARIGANRR